MKHDTALLYNESGLQHLEQLTGFDNVYLIDRPKWAESTKLKYTCTHGLVGLKFVHF